LTNNFFYYIIYR